MDAITENKIKLEELNSVYKVTYSSELPKKPVNHKQESTEKWIHTLRRNRRDYVRTQNRLCSSSADLS